MAQLSLVRQLVLQDVLHLFLVCLTIVLRVIGVRIVIIVIIIIVTIAIVIVVINLIQ